jgi:hypothetical protein
MEQSEAAARESGSRTDPLIKKCITKRADYSGKSVSRLQALNIQRSDDIEPIPRVNKELLGDSKKENWNYLITTLQQPYHCCAYVQSRMR